MKADEREWGRDGKWMRVRKKNEQREEADSEQIK